MDHLIRRVRADEWQQIRELRLAALQDPVASIAFLETYEEADAKPDSFWQGRAAGAAEGVEVSQFVGEAVDGSWAGTVTVLLERVGEGAFADKAAVDQAHVVGVFVRSEARGTGLAEALFQAAVEWSWEIAEPEIQRVRLFVHERNPLAEGLYAKCGFERTGVGVELSGPGGGVNSEMEVRR